MRSPQIATNQQSVQLVGRRPEPWEYRADSGAELARDVDRLHRRSRLLRWDVADIAAFAATAMV